MVKNNIIIRLLSMVCIGIISACPTQAQMIDSIRCEEAIRAIEADSGKMLIWNLWDKSPGLDIDCSNILDSLCHILDSQNLHRFYVFYIVDADGKPLCHKLYIDTDNDSLKNSIEVLLRQVRFVPGYIENKARTFSFFLIIDRQRCKCFYFPEKEKQKKQKKKKRFHFFRS